MTASGSKLSENVIKISPGHTAPDSMSNVVLIIIQEPPGLKIVNVIFEFLTPFASRCLQLFKIVLMILR